MTYSPKDEPTTRAEIVARALITAVFQQETRSPSLSVNELMKLSGYSRRSITLALKEIEENGRWTVKRGRGGRPATRITASPANSVFIMPEDLDVRDARRFILTEELPIV